MARQRTDGHGSDRVHVLYRLASQTPIGAWRLDGDITSQRQKPGSPTPVDAAGKPTLPAVFNQNPRDRKLDTDVRTAWSFLTEGKGPDALTIVWRLKKKQP